MSHSIPERTISLRGDSFPEVKPIEVPMTAEEKEKFEKYMKYQQELIIFAKNQKQQREKIVEIPNE